MNFNGIKAVNQNLGKVVYSTKASAALPFEHWLKDVTLDSGAKAKNQRKVGESAIKLAKQASEALGEVSQTFTNFLQKHKLDKSIEFTKRAKNQTTAANKVKIKTKNMYKSIEKETAHLKDLKIDFNDVLPEDKKKVPEKFHKIYDETRQLLSKKAHKDMLNFEDFAKVIDKDKFFEKYGEDGAVFAKKINTRLKNAVSLKIKNIFQNINSEKLGVNKFANNIDDVSSELRDTIGVRLIIKNPAIERVNEYPKEKQGEYFKNHMERQIARITDLFVDMHNSKNADMSKVTLYGGDDSYLKKANVQKLQSLGEVDVFKKKLPNNYVTTQGNMVMEISNGKKPVRIEFQIRGEEINKFAEVEHIPYDLREGKTLNLKNYNKEQRALIQKIQQASRKMAYNAELKTKYDEYLSKCFEYCLAKEYGIEKQAPVLAEGLDSSLSMESLFELSHH